MHRYLNSHRGRLADAIRDNELRVEYMGASVRNTIHVNYVISAVLAGVGGALAAITVGHIDPEMAYWTTSGEFVFVGILSGTGSVLAPFLGAVIFETIRSFAYEYSPNTWQMALGITMLLVIMFLPGGFWSLVPEIAQGRPDMTTVLEARGLNKTFGAVTAAADINVAVEQDSVVGLIGANGAGKTTFINMVTGYLKPILRHHRFRRTRHHAA